ncbi:energy transducer TonB family protein [Aminobacter sp. HY435]|uniref:energy transducer TonB family protein n=1 Tax=Aminobacter sp. HY435 TaxID=2970917 RepID=UPI0022B980AA|nr:TonB family protein [Aminobacter sp. HY435]
MSVLAHQGYEFGGFNPRELGLWSTAAAVIVSVHVAAAWYVQRMPAETFPLEQAQSAVMIDLAPMALAPEAVPQDTADLVDSAASEPVEEVTEPVEPVEADAAEPVAEPVNEVAQPEPEPAEEVAEVEPADEVVPDLVELPLPEVAMAVPQPRPAVEKPRPVVKPVRDKKPGEKKPVEKPVKQAEMKKPQPSTMDARKSAQVSDTTRAPAAGQGAGKSMSPAQWKARVYARMARQQPRVRKNGSVTVRFTFSQSGDVLTANILSSSGIPELDEAALRTVRRASPIPAPPPAVPAYLVLPITFR